MAEDTWFSEMVNSKVFLSQSKETYVEVMSDDLRKKMVAIKSKEVRDYTRFIAYEQGELVNNDKLTLMIDTLDARARYQGDAIETIMRVGGYGGKIYYDLGDCQYIEISKEGYSIVDQVPICFIRNDTMLDQKLPAKNREYDLWDLRKFINVKTDGEFDLLLINIISYFIPNIPHHILILIGNQGSSKSTVCKMIKKIVDPSIIDIYSFPTNKSDLVLHLNNAYLIPYDNLNTIPKEFNDVLCQTASGGYFLKRTLYSNDQLSAFSLQRALVLNSISVATNQPDLLDRSIVLNLKIISAKERKTEGELYEAFDKHIPYFLDHIFEVIADAMGIYDTIVIDELPRMADAVLWSCAIAEALGVGQEEYLRLYKENQESVNAEIIADNAVAFTVMQFMKEREQGWRGSITSLWTELGFVAEKHGISKSDPSWAKTPSYLSRYLNQLKVNLEREGIQFTIKNTGAYKEITLMSTKQVTKLKKKKKKKVSKK